jgi:hypothetical protein
MFDRKEEEEAAQLAGRIIAVKKIDADTAEAEFVSYCEANGIDCDEAAMSKEDLQGFRRIKDRFVKACKEGRVVVDGTSVTYTVSERSPAGYAKEKVTIDRPSGQAFIAMDGFKEEQTIHKLQAFCSAMTGKEVKYFTKLDIQDWQFFRDVAILFLSV